MDLRWGGGYSPRETTLLVGLGTRHFCWLFFAYGGGVVQLSSSLLCQNWYFETLSGPGNQCRKIRNRWVNGRRPSHYLPGGAESGAVIFIVGSSITWNFIVVADDIIATRANNKNMCSFSPIPGITTISFYYRVEPVEFWIHSIYGFTQCLLHVENFSTINSRCTEL